MFSNEELIQIENHGLSKEKVLSQIKRFKKGFPKTKLIKPCTIDDGIIRIDKSEHSSLIAELSNASFNSRVRKFVPASGAASRMFEPLLIAYDRSSEVNIDNEQQDSNSNKFINSIEQFAFYNDLKNKVGSKGLSLETLLNTNQRRELIENLLFSRGLNYANLPKALIKFHQYPGYSRTPLEEHLVEATNYAKDRNNISRIHFTISPIHKNDFIKYLNNHRHFYENESFKLEITYSFQKPSTDTISVNMENIPLTDSNGKLVFRPGGHGALLENLNDLKGDIVFIKNIDNVVPDYLKQDTFLYKKLLGGFLINVQEKIFYYLRKIEEDTINDEKLINEVFTFIKRYFFIDISEKVLNESISFKRKYIFKYLNRPFRVCSMVKNEGEPGGGPFWIENSDGSISVQIIEQVQINTNDPHQNEILNNSTHFNPVDIICGVRNFKGEAFDLYEYIDQDSGFISEKHKEGKKLKVLELPGLWNGAMAYWNTIFIEVPITTFNPVKNAIDLLRPQHQPERAKKFISHKPFPLLKKELKKVKRYQYLANADFKKFKSIVSNYIQTISRDKQIVGFFTNPIISQHFILLTTYIMEPVEEDILIDILLKYEPDIENEAKKIISSSLTELLDQDKIVEQLKKYQLTHSGYKQIKKTLRFLFQKDILEQSIDELRIAYINYNLRRKRTKLLLGDGHSTLVSASA